MRDEHRMQNTKDSFTLYKQKNMRKLAEALEKQQVDNDVISLLEQINADERFVTTSSCAGRIVVLEIPILGDKKQAVFHGCWHYTPTFSELQQALKKFTTGQLWLLAQPPIFHIAARDIDSANLLLKAGIESGFKNSGIKTLQNQCMVELLSTERLDMPLGADGTIYCDDLYLHFLLQIAEKVIKRSKEKRDRLGQTLTIFLKNGKNKK